MKGRVVADLGRRPPRSMSVTVLARPFHDQELDALPLLIVAVSQGLPDDCQDIVDNRAFLTSTTEERMKAERQ